MTIHLVFTDEILGSASQQAAFGFHSERVDSKNVVHTDFETDVSCGS